MIISGQFRDINDKLYTVTIEGNTLQDEMTVGEEGLFFTDSPFVISQDVEDSKQVMIMRSATIGMLTNKYMGKLLFTGVRRNPTVKLVDNKGNVIFDGYIEPGVYNQPFAKYLDSFTVNCTDKLSSLQYFNYKNIVKNGYGDARADMGVKTFKEIILDILNPLIDGGGKVYYDSSLCVQGKAYVDVFDDCSIGESVFFGEEYDDLYTQDKVLEAILTYLNLHIIQIGQDYYIYNNDFVRNRSSVAWADLNNKVDVKSIKHSIVTLDGNSYTDSRTNITVQDVMTQFQLKANTESTEDLFIPPLDDENLRNGCRGLRIPYMEEYMSKGNGDDAVNSINAMVKDQATTYSGAKVNKWFWMPMKSRYWKCKYKGMNVDDLFEKDDAGYFVNPWKVAKYMADRNNHFVPYIFSFGNIDGKPSANDNSPISKVDMDNYLYIQVNGNEYDTENNVSPTIADFQAASPLVEYSGPSNGNILSPIDDETVNYLVFSGKITLQPISYESTSTYYATPTNNYYECKTNSVRKTEGIGAKSPQFALQIPPYHYTQSPTSAMLASGNTVFGKDGHGDGYYYSRKFYTAEDSKSEGDSLYYFIPPTYPTTRGTGFIQPPSKDIMAQGYDYHYTYDGSEGDSWKQGKVGDYYSKLPILECELIVGNKRLVETNIDKYGNSEFKWYEIGKEPTGLMQNADGTYSNYTFTTFTLGINPKVDDNIIGQEYDLQNTISYSLGLDCEGTAIPITKADGVSGKITFRIIGAVNTTWEHVTRRHPTWFRHTKYTPSNHFIMGHTQAIIIKEFNASVYTDGAKLDNAGDNKDIVYLSDEKIDYISVDGSSEFDIITQPTSQEFSDMGVVPEIYSNAVIDSRTGLALRELTNRYTNDTAIAEKLYVDQYFRDFSKPRIQYECSLKNTLLQQPFKIIKSTTLNKRFVVQSEEIDVRLQTNNIKAIEIDD